MGFFGQDGSGLQDDDTVPRRVAEELRTCDRERAEELLPRVAEAGILVELALQARDPAVRALTRERLLADPKRYGEALTTVAIQDPEGAAGQAIVPRLEKHRHLKEVGKKAKHPAVREAAGRLARQRRRERARPSPERRRRTRAAALEDLCVQLEEMSRSDAPDAVDGVRALHAAWEGVEADHAGLPADGRSRALRERFERAVRVFEEHRTSLGRRERARRAVAGNCERFLRGLEEGSGRPAAADRERWRELSAALGDGPEATAFRTRWERLVAAVAERERAADAAGPEAERAAADLLAEAHTLEKAVDDRGAERTFRKLHKRLLALGLPAGDARLEEFAACRRRAAERVRERRRRREEELAAVLRDYDALGAEAEALRDSATEPDPRELARALKDLDRRWRDLPPAPARRLAASRRRFVAAVDELRARIRQADAEEEWERFGRVPAAERLIAAARDLLAAEDDGAVFAEIKRLQDEWRALGPLPAGRAGPLHEAFKAAADAVYARLQPFFAERDRRRAENLRRKREVLDGLDTALREGKTDPAADPATTSEIDRRCEEACRRLLDRWRALGPVPRAEEEDLRTRYRRTVAAVRKRRRQARRRRDAAERENLVAKQALLTEAEELAGRVELWRARKLPGWHEDDFLRRLRDLQGRWREVGHVPRREMGIIDRFKELCDRVDGSFGDYRERVRREERENLAAKEALVAEFEDYLSEEHPRWFKEQVAELRRRWRDIGRVPRAAYPRLRDRWRELCARFDAL